MQPLSLRTHWAGVSGRAGRLHPAPACRRPERRPKSQSCWDMICMGLERFMPETRHMITLDVLNNDSPVGVSRVSATASSSPMRGIRTPGASEQRGEIGIRSHAAVCGGKLCPDRKLTGRETER